MNIFGLFHLHTWKFICSHWQIKLSVGFLTERIGNNLIWGIHIPVYTINIMKLKNNLIFVIMAIF